MKKDRGFQIICNVFLGLFAFACIIPFVVLLSASLTDNTTAVLSGYSILPKKWSLDAYKYLWSSQKQIFTSYGITIIVTLFGTLLNIVLSTLLAYPLSRQELPGRRVLSFIVFFTMLFNGGLVPTYLMYSSFHVKNTIFGLIVPNIMMSAYYVMIIRTFFSNNVPVSVIESAKIDGASEFVSFLRIVMPMSRPIIATVVLFVGIQYWNDWYNGQIYVTESSLFSIQQLLTRMLSNIQFLQSGKAGSVASAMATKIPGETIRMAIAIVGIIPIIAIYPFVQKNFVKGIAIGAVKG